MPGDTVRITVTHRARDVGAHIRAALLLGHTHAHGHAALGPPRRESRIVRARAEHRHHLRAQCRIDRQRTDRGTRHGDRAQVPGLDLRGDKEFRAAHDFGCAARGIAVFIPCRIVNAGVGTVRHQLVIGRMEFDLVAAKAARIEGLQFRRVLVGDAAALRHRRGAPMPAEVGKFRCCRLPAIDRHGLRERAVEGEQVNVLKWRRLVKDIGRCGQGRLSHESFPEMRTTGYTGTRRVSRHRYEMLGVARSSPTGGSGFSLACGRSS